MAYWGVNLHVLLPFPVMTHGFKHVASVWRHRFNRHFVLSTHMDETLKAAWAGWDLKHPKRAPHRDRASFGDFYPQSAFIASLEPDASPAFITNGRLFFGRGGAPGIEAMQGAADGLLIQRRDARRAGAMLGLRRTATLRRRNCPGTISLRLRSGEDTAGAIAQIKASLLNTSGKRVYVSFKLRQHRGLTGKFNGTPTTCRPTPSTGV